MFLVRLEGGSKPGEGNVYALNPYTGRDGPVCDDFWGMDEVSWLFNCLKAVRKHFKL